MRRILHIFWRCKYLLAFYALTAAGLWWLLPPRPEQVLCIDEGWTLEAWSPDGRVLVFSAKSQVLFWDLERSKTISTLSLPPEDKWTFRFGDLLIDPRGRFAHAYVSKFGQVADSWE